MKRHGIHRLLSEPTHFEGRRQEMPLKIKSCQVWHIPTVGVAGRPRSSQEAYLVWPQMFPGGNSKSEIPFGILPFNGPMYFSELFLTATFMTVETSVLQRLC